MENLGQPLITQERLQISWEEKYVNSGQSPASLTDYENQGTKPGDSPLMKP